MDIGSYRFLFILTYGRSGSTVLMRLLNEVDAVQVRGENRNALFELYKAIAAVRETKTRFGTVKRSTDDPWYGADKVQATEFEKACIDSFVANVLVPAQDTEVLGFKEIGHLPNRMSEDEFIGYVRFTLEQFPRAQIIFNTRDAASVAKSGWFRDMDPDYVISEVQEADRRFQMLAKAEPQCHLIDYSNIVAMDDQTQKLFAEIGIAYDPVKAQAVLDRPLTHMKGPRLLSRGKRWAKNTFLRSGR